MKQAPLERHTHSLRANAKAASDISAPFTAASAARVARKGRSITVLLTNHPRLRRCWREIGEQFEGASRLVKEPFGFTCVECTIRLDLDLPPHTVASVILAFASEPSGGGAAT